MSVKTDVEKIALKAKEASHKLALTSTNDKNACLQEMAKQLIKQKQKILKANQKDLSLAQSQGLSIAFIDRLTLNGARLKQMAFSLIKIASLKDSVGEIIKEWKRPNGLL